MGTDMLLALGLLLAGCTCATAAAPVTAENAGFRLTVTCDGATVRATLDDMQSGLRVADGPCVYRAARRVGDQTREYIGLEGAQATARGSTLVVRGRLAGLDIRQTFSLPGDRPLMEERIVVRNPSRSVVSLTDFELGFGRGVATPDGKVLPEMADDRWVAVPLRHKATDPKGYANDFSVGELLTQPGWEPRVTQDIAYSQPPSRHRPSEGWAWLHDGWALGILRFSQEHLQWSVVSKPQITGGTSLRFGGACMISAEPAALTRLRPDASVDLGVTRYQTLRGGYEAACGAFRALLDEHGCRFPADYNPPVHWEQLYDMENAWNDRPQHYTREALEKEAQKGRAYSCEALYLDPGWDTGFATFLWGDWLGPRRAFVQEMRQRYGLGVALHTPLATWMSRGWSMGPDAVDSWPAAARRKPPTDPVQALRVPAVREGRRNLALLPEAKVSASSVFENGAMAIHQVPHLADGWYGNAASWIAGQMPAWAEVDLGRAYRVGEVRLGNDQGGQYSDRAATRLRILVATAHSDSSAAPEWQEVARLDGDRLAGTRALKFAPVQARWVRVEILDAEGGLPRLDEVEVYEADPSEPQAAAAFERSARRGPVPAAMQGGPLVCLGSRQYLAEAERRLLANCADGVVFLMFDGNWWNGGCVDRRHGHPVPYTWEDHIRANVELARRVHAKYPKVLIEMHDMLAGGSPARPTPVYYKYGLPGSYDENWGFELMWNPMADIVEGRARTLYEYNLGCNVPVYLHIDLRKDNANCLVLWWYASTCRHLGIGGTHADPAVVEAQKAAMRRYHALERFYKAGEFVGIAEEIHAHVLPNEGAFVVNLFNLSDQPREVTGSVDLADMGIDRAAACNGSDWGACRDGRFEVRRMMPPWSAEVGEFRVARP